MPNQTPDQCPTCGRMSEDWATNRERVKGFIRDDRENRTHDYTKWRGLFGGGACVSDLDAIEWRVVDGKITPRMVLELTRLDGDKSPLPAAYLAAIKTRYHVRDGQGKSVVHFARMLGVRAIIVLFRHDLTEFWLHCLNKPESDWRYMKKDEYRQWLGNL